MFGDSPIYYQEILCQNIISNKYKTQQIQTEIFQKQDAQSSSAKHKHCESQTFEFPSSLKKQPELIVQATNSMMLLLKYIQNTHLERQTISDYLQNKVKEISDNKQNLISVRSQVQIKYRPEQMFHFYRDGRLHLYFSHPHNTYMNLYPFYLQKREISVHGQQQKLQSKLTEFHKHLVHPLSKNVLIGIHAASISVISVQKQFQVQKHQKIDLLSGMCVYAQFLRCNQLKNFVFLVVMDSGRVLTISYSENGFQVVGGLKLRQKQQKIQESGRLINSASLVDYDQKKCKLLIGYEDGYVQLVEFMAERSQAINNQEDLQEFCAQKVLFSYQSKSVKKVCSLDFEIQQQHKSILQKFSLCLDQSGLLQLFYQSDSLVKYFAKSPILDFIQYQNYLICISKGELLCFQLYQQKPVQFVENVIKVQNATQIEFVSGENEKVVVLLKSEENDQFEVVECHCDNAESSQIIKDLFWGVQE